MSARRVWQVRLVTRALTNDIIQVVHCGVVYEVWQDAGCRPVVSPTSEKLLSPEPPPGSSSPLGGGCSRPKPSSVQADQSEPPDPSLCHRSVTAPCLRVGESLIFSFAVSISRPARPAREEWRSDLTSLHLSSLSATRRSLKSPLLRQSYSPTFISVQRKAKCQRRCYPCCSLIIRFSDPPCFPK